MEYFYCYDKQLMKLLRYDYDMKFICCGRHIKTNDIFWQFESTPELHNIVKEFSKLNKNRYSVLQELVPFIDEPIYAPTGTGSCHRSSFERN